MALGLGLPKGSDLEACRAKLAQFLTNSYNRTLKYRVSRLILDEFIASQPPHSFCYSKENIDKVLKDSLEFQLASRRKRDSLSKATTKDQRKAALAEFSQALYKAYPPRLRARTPMDKYLDGQVRWTESVAHTPVLKVQPLLHDGFNTPLFSPQASFNRTVRIGNYAYWLQNRLFRQEKDKHLDSYLKYRRSHNVFVVKLASEKNADLVERLVKSWVSDEGFVALSRFDELNDLLVRLEGAPVMAHRVLEKRLISEWLGVPPLRN